MWEPMKKPPTEGVTLAFFGPPNKVDEAVRLMRDLGFEHQRDEKIPWRQALDINPEKLPGELLVGARYREDMTQERLAEKTGIPRRHISEMERGKRPIGKQNAKKLGDVLNVDPRLFLSSPI